MRQETRARLERELRRQTLKKIGIGLASLPLIGLGFWLTDLDATVDRRTLEGDVEAVGPLPLKGVNDAVSLQVGLADGRHITVAALASRGLKPGDHVQVIELHHHTGRTTFSLAK